MLTAIPPAAIKGIKGILASNDLCFLKIRIKNIPRRHDALIEIYHNLSPSTKPIMPEYQTSAKPSFFFERKKASRKTARPVTAPVMENQENEEDTTMRVKKSKKAERKAMRGIFPDLISMTAMSKEKREKVILKGRDIRHIIV